VKVSNAIGGQHIEQIQTHELVHVLGRLQILIVIVVVSIQLGHVSLEGGIIPDGNAVFHGDFQHLSGFD